MLTKSSHCVPRFDLKTYSNKRIMMYLTVLFVLAAVFLYAAAPWLITKPLSHHDYEINVVVARFRRSVFVTVLVVLGFALFAQLNVLSVKAAILFIGVTLIVSVPFLIETRGFTRDTDFGEGKLLWQAFVGQRILMAITSLYSFVNSNYQYEVGMVLIAVNLMWSLIPIMPAIMVRKPWRLTRMIDMKSRVAYTMVFVLMLCVLFYLRTTRECWMVVVFLGILIVTSWVRYYSWWRRRGK